MKIFNFYFLKKNKKNLLNEEFSPNKRHIKKIDKVVSFLLYINTYAPKKEKFYNLCS